MEIIIRNKTYQISLEQVKWFGALTTTHEYLVNQPLPLNQPLPIVELPKELNGQSVSIGQFKRLIECYQEQIDSNLVDYRRPRSVLEHYLKGIFDDVNGSTKQLLTHLIGKSDLKVDVKLYQLASNSDCHTGLQEIIKWDRAIKMSHRMKTHTYFLSLENSFTNRVIRLGSVELFSYLFDRLDTKVDICRSACEYGCLNILKYALEKGCQWKGDACEAAFEYKHWDCLLYAYDHGSPCDLITYDRLVRDHQLDILTHMSKTIPRDGVLIDSAAAVGSLEILKFLHQIGCPLTGHACKSAAENGHLDCLRYIHESGCPLPSDTCDEAAGGWELPLRDTDVPSDRQKTKKAHLECMKYAHRKGCPLTQTTIDRALESGNVLCVRYAHQHGCHLRWYACERAGESGDVETLKYVHKHGYRITMSTARIATMHGHLPILKYMVEHNCRLPNDLCYIEPFFNCNVDCQLYAHQHGCPWN